jgi:hypothetical protein
MTPTPCEKILQEYVKGKSLHATENQIRTHVGIKEKKCLNQAEQKGVQPTDKS